MEQKNTAQWPEAAPSATTGNLGRHKRSLPTRILSFYVDGFRRMTVGRTLWVMILIKLFIIFFVFKLFFFPDILKRDYDNDDDRADAVRRSMLAPERTSTSSSTLTSPSSAE